MIKEVYTRYVVKTTLNVTQNKVDSVRKNDITKSGCRVYENGCIGISGCFGLPTEEVWKAAEDNLKLEIPYEYAPETGKVRSRDLREEVLSEEEFLSRSEALLDRLHQENPNFIFSNKIFSVDTAETLKNDQGLNYENRDHYYSFSIIFKHVDSNAVFDGGFGFVNRKFDVESFLRDCHTQLEAYQKPVDLPDVSEIPVVTGLFSVGSKLVEDLAADALGKGTSIFTGKLNQPLFHPDFTLSVDRSSESIGNTFFDMEGSTLDGDQMPLIENGKILRGFCDKKNAAEFGYDNTACGEGDYDDVPVLGLSDACITPSEKTLKEILGPGKAIFIDTMSGGDCTADGNFASPVQLAYLMENGEFVGRLPEFNLSGSLYEMFGKDYLGYSSDKPYFGDRQLVVRMKLSR